MREQLKVYLVTGRYDFSDTEFLKRIETACRSGVTLVQLREKGSVNTALLRISSES